MFLSEFDEHDVVLIDSASGQTVTRGQIEARAEDLSRLLASGGLAFLLTDDSAQAAVDMLGLLSASIPFALLDGSAPSTVTESLISRYSPNLILGMPDGLDLVDAADYQPALLSGSNAMGWSEWLPKQPCDVRPHAELAVLLTTSGSTGSPKFVRLSKGNIETNARQIADSLGLQPDDRGATALPLNYSFGMSILTSHTFVGSPVVVMSGSVIEPAFWQGLDEFGVTLLPGVPQTYQMLMRLSFVDRLLPSVPRLRGLMQAGGRLKPELVRALAEAMAARGGDFFVMYGQTEAAPRIACLPPARLREKLGSAGVALAGGLLEARGDSGERLPAGEVGEIFYTGPNVMMGYAESRSDVALGDVHGDTLATGDLGYLDSEGFLFLTGRAKRIAKVAGLRVSLDEVEALAAHMGLDDAVAIEAPEGAITLAVVTMEPIDPQGVVKQLTRDMRLPARSLRTALVDSIPLLPSGKIDYTGLRNTLLMTAQPSGASTEEAKPRGENDL